MDAPKRTLHPIDDSSEFAAIDHAENPVPREREIFIAAIQRHNRGDRNRFVDSACDGDALLHRRVLNLLDAHDRSDKRLECGPFSASPVEFNGEELCDYTKQTIDRYRLLERIGEGGFGAVFMAEQQSPVRRQVALKIIKPGMDTSTVIARFEAERQALAMMDHPNIARVFDAGSTRDGRPYFVMELVKGVPITEFCDTNQLSTRDRLELFVAVCRAVQHAHQKGIIHRDLKPTNVMVALRDGEPVPKVIDFGVAKALHQRLTEKTLFTRFGQIIGTPQYMSPEQSTLNDLDVDTRSDIYSLGVLAYELLTGQPPLDRERLNSASYEEILRLIREEEAPTPSSRGRSMEKKATIISRQRGSAMKRFELLRGDIDWIVMKALEKDRDRRYQSAADVAADIQRYLRNEPVAAGPPTVAYRLSKFVRRKRGLVAAGSAIAVGLLVGLALSLAGLVHAHRSAAEARANRARAERALELLQEILASPDPVSGHGPDYTVRQLLDHATEQLSDRLVGQSPDVEAELRTTIGMAYARLGMQRRAAPHLRRAVELYTTHYGPLHGRVADSLVDLAWNAMSRCRHEEANQHAAKARQIFSASSQYDKVGPDLMSVLSSSRQFVEIYHTLQEHVPKFQHHRAAQIIKRNYKFDVYPGGTLFAQIVYLFLDVGDYQSAESFCLGALEQRQDSRSMLDVAARDLARYFLAVTYAYHGRTDLAKTQFQKLRPQSEPSMDWYAENPWLQMLHAWAIVHDPQRSADDALWARRLANRFALAIDGAHAASFMKSTAWQSLALTHASQDQFPSAIDSLNRAREKTKRCYVFLNRILETQLAECFLRHNDHVQAEHVLREAVRWRADRLGATDFQASVARLELANFLYERQTKHPKNDEIEQLLRTAFMSFANRPSDDYFRCSTVEQLVRLCKEADRPGEAEKWRAQLPHGPVTGKGAFDATCPAGPSGRVTTQ